MINQFITNLSILFLCNLSLGSVNPADFYGEKFYFAAQANNPFVIKMNLHSDGSGWVLDRSGLSTISWEASTSGILVNILEAQPMVSQKLAAAPGSGTLENLTGMKTVMSYEISKQVGARDRIQVHVRSNICYSFMGEPVDKSNCREHNDFYRDVKFGPTTDGSAIIDPTAENQTIAVTTPSSTNETSNGSALLLDLNKSTGTVKTKISPPEEGFPEQWTSDNDSGTQFTLKYRDGTSITYYSIRSNLTPELTRLVGIKKSSSGNPIMIFSSTGVNAGSLTSPQEEDFSGKYYLLFNSSFNSEAEWRSSTKIYNFDQDRFGAEFTDPGLIGLLSWNWKVENDEIVMKRYRYPEIPSSSLSKSDLKQCITSLHIPCVPFSKTSVTVLSSKSGRLVVIKDVLTIFDPNFSGNTTFENADNILRTLSLELWQKDNGIHEGDPL